MCIPSWREPYQSLLALVRFFGSLLCNVRFPVSPNPIISPLREIPSIEQIPSSSWHTLLHMPFHTDQPKYDETQKPKKTSQTYQKCTVFNPIGLSHILLNQLTCAVAVAAAASVLWNLFVCFPAKRVRANAFRNVEYWRVDEELEVKKRDAALLEEEVEETNLLTEVGLKRRARVRVEGDMVAMCEVVRW